VKSGSALVLGLFVIVLFAAWAASTNSHSQPASAVAPTYTTPTVAYTAPPQPSETPERAWLRSWNSGGPTTLELQACLTNVGYDVGRLDGIDGPKTQNALNQWTAGGAASDEQIHKCYGGIQAVRALTAAQAATVPQGEGWQPTETAPASAPNGNHGDISPTNGLPRTQYVNGYTRKDGTYVAPYVRSHR
jgi:hypothetical protein